MAENPFGEVEFEQAEVGDDGVGVFHRNDIAPHREFIQALSERPVGQVAKVTIVTGEIIQKGKASKGRGKQELSEARAFMQAASEMGKGLRVGWRHNPDGSTTLRLMLQPKREFSEETQRKRNAALAKRRLAGWQVKLQANPNDVEAKQKVADLQAQINGQPAKAPAAKKS